MKHANDKGKYVLRLNKKFFGELTTPAFQAMEKI
jgi:hypothetical protein